LKDETDHKLRVSKSDGLLQVPVYTTLNSEI